MSVTLVVETGSIIPNANCYVDVQFVDDYFAQRADTTWTDSVDPDVKAGAIVRATDYLEATYKLMWKGSRRTKQQTLSWPRIGVFVGSPTSNGGYAIFDNQGFVIDFNEIPIFLKQASAELAKRALIYADLMPDIKPGMDGVTMQKVGDLEVSFNSRRIPYVKYRKVEGILTDILERSPNSLIVQRS